MRSRLGSVNLALLSLYFAPAWGTAAAAALTSPYHGLEDRAHAAAATYFRQLLDLDDGGMVLASHVLAGIKLVIAAAFVAYAIEFARAIVTRRDVDPETIDVTLTLSVIGTIVWAVPAFVLDESALFRLHATQMLMVAGALVVIAVERRLAPPALQGTETTQVPRAPQRGAAFTSTVPARIQDSRPRPTDR